MKPLCLGFTVVMKPVFSNCTCELCILRAAVMHGKLMRDVFYSSRTCSLPSNHRLQKSTYECWHSFLKGPQDILSLQYNGKNKRKRELQHSWDHIPTIEGINKERLCLHASPMPPISEYSFSQVVLWWLGPWPDYPRSQGSGERTVVGLKIDWTTQGAGLPRDHYICLYQWNLNKNISSCVHACFARKDTRYIHDIHHQNFEFRAQ